MKILVIGGGGREHALAWKIAQSSHVDRIFVAPGNGGTAKIAENVPIKADDVEALLEFARKEAIDLTVVGPELPLSLGIVDRFEKEGLKIFGPPKDAALLEASKAFSKAFMERHSIPTARYREFADPDEAKAYIEEAEGGVVVKADGLAAGKGAIVCPTKKEALDAVSLILEERAFGEAGNKVVIEELLQGEEASFIVVTDGTHVVPFPSAQDHKPVYDGDRGPNTGGMGAYSPAPVVTDELKEEILKTIIEPAIRGMREEGRPYRGVLYAGLMITEDGPKVLEFNARFGDPEAQPLMVRLKSDVVELMLASIEGRLHTVEPEWDERCALCVVMASGGYPDSYQKGFPIEGLEEADALEDVFVFHSGTAIKDGRCVTAGGRVLSVTALGTTIEDAKQRCYRAVELIRWEGVHYRKDIGDKALKRLKEGGR